MEAFIRTQQTESLTYWAPSSPNRYGFSSFGSPTTVKGKWEDRTELFISLAGVEERSQAVVFVTSDVAVQGYLYRGSSTAADPTGVTGAFEIRNFKKTPTFDGRDAERKVLL